MFLSVDLLFFGWGKIGEFYVRIFLVFMSIKVFSQVFPFYCLKKSKEVGNDCFLGSCRAIFLWDFVETDRNERTFFERVVFLLFSFDGLILPWLSTFVNTFLNIFKLILFYFL